MPIKIKSLLNTLLLVCLIVVPSITFAKPKPVPGVMAMFNNFNELEEGFRSGEWDKATATVSKIEADYKNLVQDLKGTIDGKIIQKFGFLIGSFKKHLESKDSETVEKPFLNLQSMFIDIMDHYDYPSPPVLIIVARYIDEANEALEKNDLGDAGEELEEIGGFKDRVVKAFTEKGLSKTNIDEFFEMVEQGEGIAEKNDQAGMKALLDKLHVVVAPSAQDND